MEATPAVLETGWRRNPQSPSGTSRRKNERRARDQGQLVLHLWFRPGDGAYDRTATAHELRQLTETAEIPLCGVFLIRKGRALEHINQNLFIQQ